MLNCGHLHKAWIHKDANSSTKDHRGTFEAIQMSPTDKARRVRGSTYTVANKDPYQKHRIVQSQPKRLIGTPILIDPRWIVDCSETPKESPESPCEYQAGRRWNENGKYCTEAYTELASNKHTVG